MNHITGSHPSALRYHPRENKSKSSRSFFSTSHCVYQVGNNNGQRIEDVTGRVTIPARSRTSITPSISLQCIIKVPSRYSPSAVRRHDRWSRATVWRFAPAISNDDNLRNLRNLPHDNGVSRAREKRGRHTQIPDESRHLSRLRRRTRTRRATTER